MSIICSNCGFDENPDGAEFCEACGSEIAATSSPSSPPIPNPPMEEMTAPPPPPPIPTPPMEEMTAPPPPPPIPTPPMEEMTAPPPPPPIPTPPMEEMTAPPPPPPIPTPPMEEMTAPPPPPPPPNPPMQEVTAPPPPNPPSIMGTAKLIAKQSDYPKSEFILSAGQPAIIGRFDDTTGPVDIDLGGFPGDETISRNHGEIRFEGGQWKIEPLSTTNGIFIRRAGQSRFGGKITSTEVINNGDEIAFAKLRFLFQVT